MDGKIQRRKILGIIILSGIFLLFGITRLWQLTTLPYGMHVDEAGMAYDAWCLSQYGVDRYLKCWPVYLINYGGGQSVLYAYLCAALIRIFGYSAWVVRMPAVIFSFLNLIFGMKLVRRQYPQREMMPMILGGMLTVCPYFIMAGRFGLDCNLMLGMSTVFLYCLTVAIESEKIGRYVLAGIAGGLLLYTYVLTYLIVPLFLAVTIIYLIRVKRFLPEGWVAMAIPLGMLAFPLILVQLVNILNLEEFQLGCFTITKLEGYRASEIGMFQFEKLWKALRSIFLGDALKYNSAPGYTNLYRITIVFCIFGLAVALGKLWDSVKKRELQIPVLTLLWFISILFFESHIDANVNKINGIFLTVVLLAAEGMETLLHICGRIVRQTWAFKVKAGIVTGLICVYTFCFADFAVYYYGGTYMADNYMITYFSVPMAEAIDFIAQDPILCRKKTQTAEDLRVTEIFYALDLLKSPYTFEIGRMEESLFENYQFGCLGEIENQYNYLVGDEFGEYIEELREAGFMEQDYDGYFLFYKK